MIVYFSCIDKALSLENDKIPVIVIENKALLRNVIASLEAGEEEYFTFSVDYKPVSFSKIGYFISDVFNIDLNNKKLLAKVNLFLEQNVNDECPQDIEKLLTDIVSFGDKLCKLADFDCTFNYDISVADVIKLLQLRLGRDESGAVDRLLTFILMMNKYLKVEVFIISHLHLLFDNDELSLIYEALRLNHIKLLSLECIAPLCSDNNEMLYIIDNDLCSFDNSEPL